MVKFVVPIASPVLPELVAAGQLGASVSSIMIQGMLRGSQETLGTNKLKHSGT